MSYRKQIFKKALEVLNEREKEILTLRKLRDKPLKLEELSIKFNISRERVRQIQEKALEKLQKEVSNISLNIISINCFSPFWPSGHY